MAKTQSDLINAALADVMVLGAGQTPSPEDVASVTPWIGPILADLAARRVTPTIDAEAIPDNLFPDLVRVVGQRIATLFGRPVDQAAMDAAEGRLRANVRLDRSADPFVLGILEQLELYGGGTGVLDAAAVEVRIPGILAELSARSVISLDADDLPDAVLPDLTRYVAASLANPQLMPIMRDAEIRLRHMQALPYIYAPVRADYF